MRACGLSAVCQCVRWRSVHMCTCIRMCMYMYMCVRMCVHVCVHVHVHVCVCMCVRVRVVWRCGVGGGDACVVCIMVIVMVPMLCANPLRRDPSPLYAWHAAPRHL